MAFPIAFLILPLWFPEIDMGIASSHFGMMLSAWVGAAAVRQWGKNNDTA